MLQKYQRSFFALPSPFCRSCLTSLEPEARHFLLWNLLLFLIVASWSLLTSSLVSLFEITGLHGTLDFFSKFTKRCEGWIMWIASTNLVWIVFLLIQLTIHLATPAVHQVPWKLLEHFLVFTRVINDFQILDLL